MSRDIYTDECFNCGIDCSEQSNCDKQYDLKKQNTNLREPLCYDCEYEINRFKKCIKCNKIVHDTYWDPFISDNYHKFSVRSRLNSSDTQYMTMNELTMLQSIMKSREFCYQCSRKIVEDIFSSVKKEF